MYETETLSPVSQEEMRTVFLKFPIYESRTFKFVLQQQNNDIDLFINTFSWCRQVFHSSYNTYALTVDTFLILHLCAATTEDLRTK